MSVPAVESSLFACGAILLVFGALLSIIAKIVDRNLRRSMGNDDE